MCGIAGFQGRFDADTLNRMNACIAHRGPDGAGTFLTGTEDVATPVGLGHRRLAIIDLSDAARQPMTISCERCGSTSLGDLALSFNGEIYNYRELRDELAATGHHLSSASDSEVLLHLYARDGLQVFSRLNGIFAFAIFDGRAQGRPDGVERGDVLIARDHIGVKPLYYATVNRGFLFASEIKALLRCPGVERQIDVEALQAYLAYLWTPAPRTMLAAVSKLTPGTALLVRDGRIAQQIEYYDLPYGRKPLHGSSGEIARLVASATETAVRRQMVSDVPVGAFLSGGLDSSAVVAMMRRARPDHRPICYTIGFTGAGSPDSGPSDLPFARMVAQQVDADHRVLEVGSGIIDSLERLIYVLDEPHADPAPLNALLIAEAARRDGVPVLLSGAGGDDIFSGYRRHYALKIDAAFRRLPRWARRSVSSVASSPLRRFLPWRASKLFELEGLEGDERLVAMLWWQRAEQRTELLAPGARSATTAAAPLLRSLARIPQERDPLNRLLYLEGKHFLADHNLAYTDKTGMAYGVEVRVPLLDIDLVDLATRVPGRFKQDGTMGKAIFKKAMEPYLPREVIYRKKTGFGLPLRRWLHRELHDMVETVLSESSMRSRGLFEPRAVRKLIDYDRDGIIDGTYTIFALLCMELWCRAYIDSQPA